MRRKYTKCLFLDSSTLTFVSFGRQRFVTDRRKVPVFFSTTLSFLFFTHQHIYFHSFFFPFSFQMTFFFSV